MDIGKGIMGHRDMMTSHRRMGFDWVLMKTPAMVTGQRLIRAVEVLVIGKAIAA